MSNRLGNSALIYVLANIANAAVPFLLLPLLTRVLTPEDYGLIAMYAVTLGIFGAFTGLSVHGAVAVQYFQLNKAEMARFVTACLWVVLISSSIVAAIVLFISPLLTEVTGLPRDWLLAGVGVSSAQILSQIRLSLWQVEGKPLRYGIFQFSQTFSNALLSVFLILGVGMAWEGRLLGQSAAIACFGALGLFWLVQARYTVRQGSVKDHLYEALRFGVPLIPHVLGGLVLVALDRYIIVSAIGLASAGIYVVAAQIGMILGLLTDAFNKAYAPWLMSRLASPNDPLRLTIVRGTYFYFAVVLSIALSMGAMASLIVGAIAGDAFAESASVVLYLALGYAFNGCYLMVTNYIFFEKRTALLAYVTFSVGILHIGMTYFLVQANGIIGAGQAFAISQFLAFVSTWVLAQRVHPMPWRLAYQA